VIVLNYLHEAVYLKNTKSKGRGVFTKKNINEGILIEIAPVIILSKAQRKLLDQTLLHDYIFEWGENDDECCMALGYVALYNHSYKSNCEYEMELKKAIIKIKTVRQIKAGEELYINYNGTWNNEKPVWFDKK
jgi:SET domain-containing protein